MPLPSSQDVTVANLPDVERANLGFLGAPSAAPVPAVTNPTAAPQPNDARPRNADGTYAPREEPAAPTEATVTTQAKHPQELYDAAIFFGLTEAEADEYPTRQLNKMLWRMQQQQNAANEAINRARTFDTRAQVPQQQEPPEPDEQIDLADELELAPKTQAIIKRMFEENKQLKKKLGAVESGLVSQTVSTHTQHVDQAIARLGPQAAKVFGDGEYADFPPGTPENSKRMRLYHAAGLGNGVGANMSAAQINKAIKGAYDDLYGHLGVAPGYEDAPAPKPALPIRPAGAIDPKEWERGGLGAPTQRVAEELPDGEEKAVRNLAKKMGKQVGQYDEDRAIKETLLRRNGTQ